MNNHHKLLNIRVKDWIKILDNKNLRIFTLINWLGVLKLIEYMKNNQNSK